MVAWTKLRTRAWAKYTAFSVWMLLVLANAIVFPAAKLLHGLSLCLLGVLIGWTLLMWVVDRSWAEVPCPRCKNAVDWPPSEMGVPWMDARADMRCPHCGIKIGTPKFPEDDAI